jgi:hypothetical protein
MEALDPGRDVRRAHDVGAYWGHAGIEPPR